MGWVSYLEDVRDRLDRDLGDLRKTYVVFEERHSEARVIDAADLKRVNATIESVGQIRKDIDSMLSLATDPTFDSVMYTAELRSTIERQKAEIQKLRSEVRTKDTRQRQKDLNSTLLLREQRKLLQRPARAAEKPNRRGR